MALTKEQMSETGKAATKLMYYNRPPLEIRNQLNLGYSIEGQSVYLLKMRAVPDNPELKIESSIAKTTFIKSQNPCSIYRMRDNLKWYCYEAVPYE